MRASPLAIAIACTAASLAGPVQAHVVLAPGDGAAKGYFFGAFRVGHGCAGAATTALRIEVPPETPVLRPQPKPGWTLSIEHAPLAQPFRGEDGRMIKERVAAVTWSGGPLPDDQWDEFGVAMKLPDRAGRLVFPTTQTCGALTERWVEVPAEGQGSHALRRPAPTLQVTQAVGSDPMAGMKMGDP